MSGTRYAGTLISGGAVEFEVVGGKIGKVTPVKDSPHLPWLLPVLVDLQQNGAVGHAFSTLETPDQLRKVAEALLRHGVGRVQATTVSVPLDKLRKSVGLIADECAKDPLLDALIFGLFHEGIFMSFEEGWRGDHDVNCIMKPDWDVFRATDEAAGGRFITVNVGPEIPGAMEFISKAVEAGKKVSLGHCNPDTATIREAAERGADRITHFGNGAAPMVHRFRNPFWEFLNNPKLKPGLICDGFHLPPELVSCAMKIKGRENCLVVSDASRLSGCKPGIYDNGTHQLEPDGYLHVVGQEILAGSSCQQNTCVNFLMRNLGFSMLEAWRQCSLVPAAHVGIKLPEIKEGEEASFVVVREEKNAARIEKTVFMGSEHPFAEN